jgi:uncharacterized protein YbjT (DUF2867 family)
MPFAEKNQLVLLTGATGYVGGRLLSALESQGRRIRCLTRRPEFLRRRVLPTTELARGDVRDAEALRIAMQQVDAAYYLVHSMSSTGSFEQEDRLAAATFAAVARECGVRRLVYLGGLGHADNLSNHLASRQEVGEILNGSGVPTIEFRAAIIIGSGSLSFEIVRALVEKLPVMVTPRWVRMRTQPIAIEDALAYLTAALDLPLDRSAVFEIGGPDQVSYKELMGEYARQRGLRRWMIPVPILTPRLSSLWLGLVTPVYARVGRKLIDSLPNETIVRDDTALRTFPVRPRTVPEAIARALRNEDQEFAATRWSDALSSFGEAGKIQLNEAADWGGVKFGSRLVDSRSTFLPVAPAAVFAVVARLGGNTGWYFGKWLWILRGWLDLLVGGPGMRRGRRHPTTLLPGDTLDWWRVEEVQPGRLLLLFAEMKLPGRAWLQFEIDPESGGSRLRQTAIFDPVGLSGLLYWYGIYPVHKLVFAGLLRGIAQAASKDKHAD